MAKYGPLYRSMYYFTSVHIDAAGNPVCDEFHKGMSALCSPINLAVTPHSQWFVGPVLIHKPSCNPVLSPDTLM